MALFTKPELLQPHSPLHKLPGELRNRIYEAYLITTLKPDDPIDVTNIRHTGIVPHAPPTTLMRTCQHIYHELPPLYNEAESEFWSHTVKVIINPRAPTHSAFIGMKDTTLNRVSVLMFEGRTCLKHGQSLCRFRHGADGSLATDGSTGVLSLFNTNVAMAHYINYRQVKAGGDRRRLYIVLWRIS